MCIIVHILQSVLWFSEARRQNQINQLKPIQNGELYTKKKKVPVNIKNTRPLSGICAKKNLNGFNLKGYFIEVHTVKYVFGHVTNLEQSLYMFYFSSLRNILERLLNVQTCEQPFLSGQSVVASPAAYCNLVPITT